MLPGIPHRSDTGRLGYTRVATRLIAAFAISDRLRTAKLGWLPIFGMDCGICGFGAATIRFHLMRQPCLVKQGHRYPVKQGHRYPTALGDSRVNLEWLNGLDIPVLYPVTFVLIEAAAELGNPIGLRF